MDPLETRVRAAVRDIPDFPKPGIIFKDITTVLRDGDLFADVIEAMVAPWRQSGITHIVAIESRGFIFGAPVAQQLRAAFVPMRKPGKLPSAVRREEYDLEYGRDALEVHQDAMTHGARALIVDDVLATGGTAAAACRLAEQFGVPIVGCAFLLELQFLGGRALLGDRTTEALVKY
jgi:adenine phosphoribosyltransferase